jgi:hypothetical protein
MADLHTGTVNFGVLFSPSALLMLVAYQTETPC